MNGVSGNGRVTMLGGGEGSRGAQDIPKSAKQLARLIIHIFYPPEDLLIFDLILRNGSIYESQLEDFLKYDKKLLAFRLDYLKKEKMITIRIDENCSEDVFYNRSKRYCFINYVRLINVVKYKLEIMRKKLESTEHSIKFDNMVRGFFRCQNKFCRRSYSVLSARELYDKETANYSCIICLNTVLEDKGEFATDPRLKIVKFNEQLEVIFHLLREVENIKLIPEMFELPPPSFLKNITQVVIKQ